MVAFPLATAFVSALVAAQALAGAPGSAAPAHGSRGLADHARHRARAHRAAEAAGRLRKRTTGHSSTGIYWASTSAWTGACGVAIGSDGIGLPLSVYSDVNAVSSLCGTEVVVTSSTGQSLTLTVQDGSDRSAFTTMSLASFVALGGKEDDGEIAISFKLATSASATPAASTSVASSLRHASTSSTAVRTKVIAAVGVASPSASASAAAATSATRASRQSSIASVKAAYKSSARAAAKSSSSAKEALSALSPVSSASSGVFRSAVAAVAVEETTLAPIKSSSAGARRTTLASSRMVRSTRRPSASLAPSTSTTITTRTTTTTTTTTVTTTTARAITTTTTTKASKTTTSAAGDDYTSTNPTTYTGAAATVASSLLNADLASVTTSAASAAAETGVLTYGELTWYSAGDGGYGSCGVELFDGALDIPFVAMSLFEWMGAPGPSTKCFECVAIHATSDPSYKVTAIVADSCQACTYGHLDAEQALFDLFGGNGVIDIGWEFVACPSGYTKSALEEVTSSEYVAIDASE